jgi:hypothetical protein
MTLRWKFYLGKELKGLGVDLGSCLLLPKTKWMRRALVGANANETLDRVLQFTNFPCQDHNLEL